MMIPNRLKNLAYLEIKNPLDISVR